MSVTNELSEMVLGSKVQTPEAIQKVLDDLGYEGVSTEVQTDEPSPETDTTPVAEKAEPETTDSALLDDAGDIDGEGDGENEEAVTEAAQTPDKKKSGSARRKERLIKLQSENEELKRQLAGQSAAKPAEVKFEEPVVEIPASRAKPTLEDVDDDGNPKYSDYDDLTVAIVDWRSDERDRQRLETAQTARKAKTDEAATAQAAEAQAAYAARWNEQVEIGKATHDDYEAVYAEAVKMPAAVPLTTAIRISPMAGELIYHLGTHPDELGRLNQLLDLPANPTEDDFNRKMQIAYRELAVIEAQLSNVTEEAADTHAATGSGETQGTDAARESREAAPKPAAAPRAKPEPMKPVGNRGAGTRKRLNDLTRDEAHAMQSDDPEGFRKLVEAA